MLAPIVGSLDGRGLAAGIAVLHVALGLLTIALTHGTARRWGYSPNRAVIAAAIVALDPVVLTQSRHVMTETLAACLVAACLASMALEGKRGQGSRARRSGSRRCAGPACCPARCSSGSRAAFGPGDRRRRLLDASLFALGVLAPLLPWARET